jgi:hypothetical protein
MLCLPLLRRQLSLDLMCRLRLLQGVWLITKKSIFRLYNIIYDCINEVQMALEGLLKPEIKEEVTAEVEVRRILKLAVSALSLVAMYSVAKLTETTV